MSNDSGTPRRGRAGRRRGAAHHSASYFNAPAARRATAGIRADKSLGQHILHDETILSDLVEFAAPVQGKTILEVGAGPGGLTRTLLEAGARYIHAIELDERWRDALVPLESAHGSRLSVTYADALRVSPAALHPLADCIVSNLPYNIATKLITWWLTDSQVAQSVRQITVLVQQEVAKRLASSPCTAKSYGSISVLAQWRGAVTLGPVVPPEAFSPPPKVNSQAVRIVLYPLASAASARRHGSDVVIDHASGAISARELHKVTAAAFAQRRKKVSSALRSLFGERTEQLLRAAGVHQDARGEDIAVSQYITLASKGSKPSVNAPPNLRND